MGQRHQLFVIAKIANRYRGLAVFHHQWLYGATALERCLRILTIFSAPANRLPIQQELTAAGRLDEKFWTNPRSWEDSEVPFPFITTCLLLGASFDIKPVYSHGVILEPFNMPFNGGDNNDGITVIDITDLTHVRYCFVLWGSEWEVEEKEEEEEEKDEEDTTRGGDPQLTPLSGPIYLSAYYNAEERSKHPQLQTKLQALEQQYDEWDLIDIASLANTWPQGEWWLTAGTETMVDADTSQTVRSLPSLRESTLARLVDVSLQNADLDLSWTAEAELLPDFYPAVKARIYSEPTLLASPVAKALFLKAIEHEQEVDLSPFQDLSMDEILSITSGLSKETKSLSLSGNVTAELLALLAENPSICKIYVLDAPNLQLQSALQVMSQRGSPWVYHAEMFRAPLESTSSNCSRLPHEDEQRTPGDATDLLPKASERFPVVQILWLSRGTKGSGDVTRLDDGGIPWATVPPKPDRDYFLSRGHASIAAFPLRDGFLTISRVVTGLAKFIQCLAESYKLGLVGGGQESGVAVAAANCFALAASDLTELDTAKQVEVGPLPGKLSAMIRDRGVGRPPPNVQPLRPGEWTIVIAHEPRKASEYDEEHPGEEKLRYAFITTASSKSKETPTGVEDAEVGRMPGSLIIADMESFLERAVKIKEGPSPQDLLKFWKQATKGLRGEFGVCGGDEIASILGAQWGL